jgi:hypothetical protein
MVLAMAQYQLKQVEGARLLAKGIKFADANVAGRWASMERSDDRTCLDARARGLVKAK